MDINSEYVGSYFDEFLKEEGILEEVELCAIKRVLSWQFQEGMKSQKLSKKAMSEKIGTSRSQLDRLLNPDDTSVTLKTLVRAANTIGLRLEITLEPIKN